MHGLDSGKKKASLYWMLVIFSLLLSVAVFIYFSLQTKVYRSVGKFAVFYSNDKLTTDLSTSNNLSKSIAESIKTRHFLEGLSQASGVSFADENLENGIGNIVKADIVNNSNIITVEFNDESKENLDKINSIFLSQLKSSKIIEDSSSMVEIQVIDPMYTFEEEIYPEPIKYALLTFVGVLSIGLLAIYTLVL